MGFDDFSERVRALRKQANLTQKQVGEAVGLSMQAINDIEHGRRTTTMGKTVALARLFNVNVEYLLDGDGVTTRTKKSIALEADLDFNELRAFTDRLCALRTERQLTIQQMSKALGIPPFAYKRLEHHGNLPELSDACRIADFFNVSLDYLVGRSDDPKRH